MEAGVEHDDGEGQHVARVLAAEHALVALAVPRRKLVHHAVDLLGLARKPKAPQILPKG